MELNLKKLTLGLYLLGYFLLSSAHAASYSAGYDVGSTVFEPHPFSIKKQTVKQIYYDGSSPQSISNRVRRIKEKQTMTNKFSYDSPILTGAKKDKLIDDSSGFLNVLESSSWLSEIKFGILKHSAAISTSTPKEKGADANFEVLFVSPKFLNYIWSPRPHIGASVNASSKDTDQVYTGLTWGWEPFKHLFIDASFGFAMHNGVRGTPSNDPLEGRVREFGCDWLFRESLEFGFPFLRVQRVSIMWDHISHGGICASENEGMDNLGLRYGYQF